MRRIYLKLPECEYENKEAIWNAPYQPLCTNEFTLEYDDDEEYYYIGYFEDDFPQDKIKQMLLKELDGYIKDFKKNYIEDLNKMKNYLNELRGEI